MGGGTQGYDLSPAVAHGVLYESRSLLFAARRKLPLAVLPCLGVTLNSRGLSFTSAQAVLCAYSLHHAGIAPDPRQNRGGNGEILQQTR